MHKSVTVEGSSVPLHSAAQLADGYLLHPTSSQAFEYGGGGVAVCACVPALTHGCNRYDHVVGVVRNTRALEHGEVRPRPFITPFL